jgi:Glycosyl transferase family 2
MTPGKLRCLGVLLCYNDGDLVEEAVRYLREQDHHVIAWDHGSEDETPSVLQSLRSELVELTRVPREFDFYELYPEMSRHLRANYVDSYDWISWPDQDEFLEGPDRTRSYRDWLEEVAESGHDWIRFHNYNYWFTAEDDPAVTSTVERVRHYALFPDCAFRIRAWRAAVTNRREFNHNPLPGRQYPVLFNLRHYPMRSLEQMKRRVHKDRGELRRGGWNNHYENMRRWPERLIIPPESLHLDDGGELDPSLVFDWRAVYGRAYSRAYPDRLVLPGRAGEWLARLQWRLRSRAGRSS